MDGNFRFNFKFTEPISIIENNPSGEQVEETKNPIAARTRNQSLTEVRKDVITDMDISEESVLHGTASATNNPIFGFKDNAIPWSGNQSLIKVKKDILKDIFKEAIIFSFSAPFSIDGEEDDCDQSPAIEFQFTPPLCVDGVEDEHQAIQYNFASPTSLITNDRTEEQDRTGDTLSNSFEYSSGQPVPATETSQHSSQNKSCQVTPAQSNPSVPVSRGGAGAGQKKRRPERAVYVPPRGRGKPLSANAIEFNPNKLQYVLVS